MDKIVIKKDQVQPLHETRFISLYDLQYKEGVHYFDASRHKREDLTALKTDEEFKAMTADAATIMLVVKTPKEEPRLYLQYEYRYPTGQFLLSPPAGLLDPEDREEAEPLKVATIREIKEETGIDVKETDTFKVLNPLVFSTPGMTDESNALTLAYVTLSDLSSLTTDGAVGTECFDGYQLLTKAEAADILKAGRDPKGIYYSAYTQIVLLYFVSGLWENES